MKTNYLIIFLALFYACTRPAPEVKNAPVEAKTPRDSAQMIAEEALAAQGAAILANSIVEFDFRQSHFKVTRRGGSFAYERSFRDSTGHWVHDVLTNANFMREVNGKKAMLLPKDSAAYSSSVNSVVYFALQPYFLNDKAVQKKYLGTSTIKGEPYDKVEVRFSSEGGGKDFEDRYVYWFHQHKHTLDYLAYNYQVEGGGARFREAYNTRIVNGVRFADYLNYQPKSDRRDIEVFDQLFLQKELTEVSKVLTENIKVLVLN